MTPVTPTDLDNVAKAIDQADDNPIVVSVEKAIIPRIPKHVRGALYSAGKWIGVAGAVGLTVAAALQGAAALYVAAGAGVLLAASNALAKANLS